MWNIIAIVFGYAFVHANVGRLLAGKASDEDEDSEEKRAQRAEQIIMLPLEAAWLLLMKLGVVLGTVFSHLYLSPALLLERFRVLEGPIKRFRRQRKLKQLAAAQAPEKEKEKAEAVKRQLEGMREVEKDLEGVPEPENALNEVLTEKPLDE